MSTLHPSHAAPKCVNCKHLIGRNATPKCGHPSAPVNLVDGEPDMAANMMRTALHKVILDKLAMPFTCGPEGRLFEALPTTCTECGGAGSVRIPYSAEFEPCSLCTSAEISASTATTAASA